MIAALLQLCYVNIKLRLFPPRYSEGANAASLFLPAQMERRFRLEHAHDPRENPGHELFRFCQSHPDALLWSDGS